MYPRILHINHEKTWRGGERQALMTVCEQRKQGIDSWTACRHGAPLEEKCLAAGVPTIALPSAAPLVLLKLARVMRGFDLIHCHSGRAHSMATLADPFARRPLVVSRRVDFLPRNSWFNRFKYRRADRIVCVSQYIANQMRTWMGKSGSLSVIYDAAEPDENPRSKEACVQELRLKVALPPGMRIVGNIAALVGHKDHATLLRAARSVVDRCPEIAFVIIGDGKIEEDLLRLRGELDLDHYVHFTGFLPNAQTFLPAFDVFAMSSCMEGLGSIVLDANLAGVPVAATAGGGLPEIVENNETGLLVPVGDAKGLSHAILQLLNDPALGARLTRHAQARTRAEFSPAQMASKYFETYQEIRRKRRARSPRSFAWAGETHE